LRKKNIFILIGILAVVVLVWMIIPQKTKIKFVSSKYELNEKFNNSEHVFSLLDFTKGHFSLYLVLEDVDYDLIKRYNKISGNCMCTEDINVIKEILLSLEDAKGTGGDIATVGSYIVLKRNNKTIYFSEVLFNKHEIDGLQNGYRGACLLKKPINLDVLKHFSSCKNTVEI
jgi:hypothetical protein